VNSMKTRSTINAGSRYKLSHWAVRAIALVNIMSFLIGRGRPGLIDPRESTLGLLFSAVLAPLFLASLALPLYVAIEFWWMRGARSEQRSLVIDLALVLVWFYILLVSLRPPFPWL